MVRTLILTASLLAIGAGAAVAAAPPTWKLRLQQLVARGLWLCAGDRAGAGLPVLGDGLRADLQLVRGRVDDGLRRRDELRARGRHEDAGDLRAGTRPGRPDLVHDHRVDVRGRADQRQSAAPGH